MINPVINITRKVLSAAFVTAGLSLALSVGSLAQEVAWDMPNEYGESSITGEADKIFAERLEKNSNGRIKITNHFGGSLGYKSKDTGQQWKMEPCHWQVPIQVSSPALIRSFFLTICHLSPPTRLPVSH